MTASWDSAESHLPRQQRRPVVLRRRHTELFSLRRPGCRQLLNFWWHYYFRFGQHTGSPTTILLHLRVPLLLDRATLRIRQRATWAGFGVRLPTRLLLRAGVRVEFDSRCVGKQITLVGTRHSHDSDTAGDPRVSVPFCRKSLCPNSGPFRVRVCPLSGDRLSPSDVEIAITSGIASPNACGQAMMRTVAVLIKACSLSPKTTSRGTSARQTRRLRKKGLPLPGRRGPARETRSLRHSNQPHNAG